MKKVGLATKLDLIHIFGSKLFCAMFIKIRITFSYRVYFLCITTQNIQKKTRASKGFR
jgi:hypothetical protein